MSTASDHRFYASKAWDDMRRTALRRFRYTCVQCGKSVRGKKYGGETPHVDHVISRRERPDLALSLSNLVVLCHSCHSIKTMATEGVNRHRPKIGSDGFPEGWT